MQKLTALTLLVALAVAAATPALAGGLNLNFSRCDLTANYKPVEDFADVTPGTKLVVPEWHDGGRVLTATSGVFLWEERDYMPTVKARYDGGKSDLYVPVAKALYCK